MHLAAGGGCAASPGATLGLSSCCPSTAHFEVPQPCKKEQRARSSAPLLLPAFHSCTMLFKPLLHLSLHNTICSLSAATSSGQFNACAITGGCLQEQTLELRGLIRQALCLSYFQYEHIFNMHTFNKRPFERPESV